VVERVGDGHGAVDVEEHSLQGSHSADPTVATTHTRKRNKLGWPWLQRTRLN
jgi:hypothetical protein